MYVCMEAFAELGSPSPSNSSELGHPHYNTVYDVTSVGGGAVSGWEWDVVVVVVSGSVVVHTMC